MGDGIKLRECDDAPTAGVSSCSTRGLVKKYSIKMEGVSEKSNLTRVPAAHALNAPASGPVMLRFG